MRIEINKEFNPREFIDKNNKVIQMQLKRNYVFLAILASIGFLFFLNDNFKTTENSTDLSFSMVCMLLALLNLIQLLKVRKTAKDIILTKAATIKGQVRYLITDDEIIYADSQCELKLKWSFYTHFQFLGDYILITNKINGLYFNSILINKNDMDKDAYYELTVFLRKCLIEKKNKNKTVYYTHC